MADGSRDEHTIDDVIAALEGATEGSGALDRMVAFQLGLPISESDQMVKLLLFEGYGWDVISELVQSENPSFSTALDAAIPGENIVLAMRSAKRQQWAAIHRSVGGSDFMAWAATEPLARRAAALRGLRAASSFDRRGSVTGATAPGRSAVGAGDAAAPAAEGDAAEDAAAGAAADAPAVEPPRDNPARPNDAGDDLDLPVGGEWKILF